MFEILIVTIVVTIVACFLVFKSLQGILFAFLEALFRGKRK